MAGQIKTTRKQTVRIMAIVVAVALLAIAMLMLQAPSKTNNQTSPRDMNWDFNTREEPKQALADIEVQPRERKNKPTAHDKSNTEPRDSKEGAAVNENDSAIETDVPMGTCAAQQVLLAIDGSVTKEGLIKELGEHGITATDVRLVSKSLNDNGVLVEVTYEEQDHPEDVAQMLAKTDLVRSAGANYVETLAEVSERDANDTLEGSQIGEETLQSKPNDRYYNQLWGNEAIGASTAWDMVKANRSVTVAVLDSGVDTDHPDLASNLILGSYAKNTYYGYTGSSYVEDSIGHGTHVAGIIAAVADNGVGVAGVSYNARILPIKVTAANKGTMHISDVIAGIDYVVNLKTKSSSPEYLRNIRVINLSLGGYNRDTTGEYQRAIRRANEAGILVVAAAGNEATSLTHYPSAYEGALGVSALKRLPAGSYTFDNEYSNYGSYVDVSAPGTDIYSTVLGGSYENKTGTSMATPMVSGAAALVYAKNMAATPSMVEAILEDTADDLGTAGPDDHYGSGLIRVDRAVGAKHLGLATVAKIPDQPLRGESVKPSPTVSYEGNVLAEGRDYALSYKNNTSAGTGSVIITGKGDYVGTQEITFVIYTLDITEAQIASIPDHEYTGSPIEPTLTVVHRGVTLARDKDYHVEFADNIEVGTASVRVIGAGDYEGQQAVEFNIVRRNIASATLSQIGMQEYTGSAIEPDVTLSVDGTKLKKGRDYTVSYDNNTELGVAKVTVTGAGNYTGVKETTFQIAHLIDKPDEGMSLTYTGEEQAVLPSEADAWFTYEGDVKATNRGIYTATVKLKDNVYWSDGTRDDYEFSWRMLPKKIAIPQSIGDPDLPFTGGEQQGVPDGEGYTLSGDVSATEQGTYSVKATLISRANYVWDDETNTSKTIEWVIGPTRSIPKPVAVEGLVYNGEEQQGVADGKGYTLQDAQATNAGDYTAVASLKVGYRWDDGNEDSLEIPWSIARKPVAKPSAVTYTFDGTVKNALELTDEGIEAGDTFVFCSGIQAVALGDEHSTAVTASGELLTWGDNVVGQLGDGTKTGRSEPVKVMDGVAAVALGGYHSAAITASGELWTWGSNYYGQLGDGTKTDRSSPVKVMDGVAAVALGDEHSAAITESGELWTWGRNYYGQLGDGTETDRSEPVKVMDGVAAVALGGYHSAAITASGELWTWGRNYYGQLGDGTTTYRSSPVKVMDGVAAVALGGYHSAAITASGELWTWGRNDVGQLGDGTKTGRSKPVKVMDGVAAVALGGYHSAAITASGVLLTWGRNYYGQLGYGTPDRSVPVMEGVSAVALGDEHSAAITESGELWTWGKNDDGQLGYGTIANREVLSIIWLSSNASTYVGTYKTTVTPKQNYCWEDGTDKPYIVGWDIQPALLGIPTKYDNMYDGEEHVGVAESEGFALKGVSRATDAGSYEATVTPDANHVWADGTRDAKTLTWEIARRPVDPEELVCADSVYDGEEHVGVAKRDGIALEGVSRATDAGSYEVTAMPDANHMWSDGTSEAKTLSWSIARQPIDLSEVVATDFEYDGKNHAGINSRGGEVFIISDGIAVASKVGTYTATLMLVNDNYCWDDGTIEDKTVTWRIVGQTYDMSRVSFQGKTLTYDGKPHGLAVNGTLPEGVTVTYDGNGQIEVGVYEVTAHFTGDSSTHEPIDDMVATLAIEPILVDVPEATFGLTYNGQVQVGIDVPDDAPYQVVGTLEETNAGTYTAAARLKNKAIHAWNTEERSNEDLSLRWMIAPRSIVGAEIGRIDPVTYQGVLATPVPSVMQENRKLKLGKDYTLRYEDNNGVGTAGIIVEGMGNYSGILSTEFDILPCPIDGAQVTFDQESYTFTREPVEPLPRVYLNNALLNNGIDYQVEYANNVLVGVATATITGLGNYTGTIEETFVISERPLRERVSLHRATLSLDTERLDYTGEKNEPVVRIFYNGQELVAGLDYIVGYQNNVNVGKATVMVSGVGNYTDVVSLPFTIDPVSLAGAHVTLDNVVYTGSNLKLAPLVVLGGRVLEPQRDYVLHYEDNVEAGNAYVIISGIGNYEGNASADFTIAKAKCSVTPAKGSYTVAMGRTCTIDASTNGGGALSYKVVSGQEYAKVSSAGEVTPLAAGGTAVVAITASETSNFEAAAATVEVTVTKGSPTIKASSKEVAAGQRIAVDASVTRGAGVLAYASSNQAVAVVDAKGLITGKSAGTAQVTITFKGNNNWDESKKVITVTVKKAANGLKVKASKKTVKLSKVRTKSQSVKPLKVSGASGKVSYAKIAKGSAKVLSVNKKTGKVAVKKGTKKGAYKVKIKVTAKGDAGHEPAAKIVTATVRVK